MKMYLIFLTVLQVFLTLGCEEEPIECGEDFCDPATEFCITLSGTIRGEYCVTECDRDSDCEVCCATSSSGRGYCSPLDSYCSNCSNCRSNEVCYAGSCTPTCTSNSDCSTNCCRSYNHGAGHACAPASVCGGGGDDCDDQTSCVSVSIETGEQCSNPSSRAISATNECSYDITIQCCLQRADGSWDCGMNSRAGPGERCYHYVCEGNGVYFASGNGTDYFGTECIPDPH